MARFDIQGIWQGEYWYGPNEDFDILPPPTQYELEARAGWFGFFRGTVQDKLPSGSTPEIGIAAISGRVSGFKIRFTKVYPVMLAHWQGRTITMREYLRTVCNLPVQDELPAVPVFYEGVYDPFQREVSGTWMIGRGSIPFKVRGQPWETGSGALVTGGWKMRRA